MSISSDLLTDQDFIDYFVQSLGSSISAVDRLQNYRVSTLDGNLNRVRRISFEVGNGDKYSFIVKQAPAGGGLVKFPSIKFLEDRLAYEYQWYQFVNSMQSLSDSHGINRIKVPHIYSYNDEKRVLISEDLGVFPLSSLFHKSLYVVSDIVSSLGCFLGHLHSIELQVKGVSDVCNESAALNRYYVFKFHIEKPELVQEIWKQAMYTMSPDTKSNIIEEELRYKTNLQESFLKCHRVNIETILEDISIRLKNSAIRVYSHGDLHIDSIMLLPNSDIYLIDAELSDSIHPGYDIGTLSAHLIAHSISKSANLNQAIGLARTLISSYLKVIDSSGTITEHEVSALLLDIARYTGAELIRRLIGPAAFSCNMSEEQHRQMIDLSTSLLLNPIETI